MTDVTPAVLRWPDGRQSRGELETVSLTGGMLITPEMLGGGSSIKLIFLTQSGPVLGTAELLTPVSTTQQPFRFVTMDACDQIRLRSVVQSLMQPAEEAWIRKYRAAMIDRRTPRPHILRKILLSLALTLCLGSAFYLLHSHLLK